MESTAAVNEAVASTEETKPSLNELADRAAMDFKVMMPLFKRYIPVLSNKAKDRVVNAMLEFPLYDREPIFQTAREKDLFDLGLRILDAKTVMIQAAYSDKMKDALEEKANNVVKKEGEENV
jgi:hypothetical protein